jgi:hypothetical protein
MLSQEPSETLISFLTALPSACALILMGHRLFDDVSQEYAFADLLMTQTVSCTLCMQNVPERQ